MGAMIAGYDFLLGEVQEFSRCMLMGCFNTGSGTKGPAGSAMTLVLDGIDVSLGSPVNGALDVVVVHEYVVSLVLWDDLGSHVFFHLPLSHVGHEVVSKL